MKPFVLFILFTCCGVFTFNSRAQGSDYADLKSRAEAFIADGSYSKAHDLYAEAAKLKLSTADARWVDYRLADTLWRAASATENPDNTQVENAQHQLEVLIRDIKRTEDRDRVWAEVQKSLGDFFWTRRYQQNWGEAWPHYEAALDWWAGAADIELARERYLKIIWSITERPSWRSGDNNYYYWYYGGALPTQFLENALKIAKTPEDQARAHFLLAMMLRNQGGDWDQIQRVPEEFECAIKLGKTTDWYGEALFNYALWMENNGRVIVEKDGNWRQEPDYLKALELFRVFVKEFKKGESPHFDQAKQEIANIIDPSVSVSVANIFLPDSEVQYSLNWRNQKKIRLAIYAVDLARDVHLDGDGERRSDWLQTIDLAGREKIKAWTYDTKDKGVHKPGTENLRLDGKLMPGAYVLEARGEKKSARELLLVTDASVVLKTSGKQALVYMCDAIAGSPLSGAHVKLWERYYEDNHWHWRETSKTGDTNGIAVFDLMRKPQNEEIFVGAALDHRQAFATGNINHWSREDNESWRIYAFTDRPAYRPSETANWKFIARQRAENGSYLTPSGKIVEFEITDPRGAKVKSDKATLNDFGSAWGSLGLTDKMPLGEYHITFWNEGRRDQIGSAVLFRLEEYKLPEFKVTVQTPEENGRKKAFRLGEQVEVTVQADYYFGGAVADASVEIIVHQQPYIHYWHRPHEFDWYYEDMMPGFSPRRRFSGDQIIKRETVKTDATGKAKLIFDTPRGSGDLEYSIEARVTDASRREITGNGSVRVTNQRYYVTAEPSHNLYHPGQKSEVDFKALDANDQPVITEGSVKVTRERWVEIWLDSNGREVSGEELKNFRNRSLLFPPPPTKPDERPWRLKFRGYQPDEILAHQLKTDTNGTAQITFTPEKIGFYRIVWTSPDNGPTNARPAPPIHGETTIWVANDSSTELGYRHSGVEIIVDKDTFRVGEKTPVMLSVPESDRYVLFTVEGADLYDYQLVHVTGTVKLIEFQVEERHVPNIFLGATLVSDSQVFSDNKQIVVPPEKNFLKVEVTPDREQYQPRETGTFTITARNDKNEPVAAEVAFALVDESVFYIQSDYAGDPRQFYYGVKRPQLIQNVSTFNQKPYAELVFTDEKKLMEKRDWELFKKRRFRNELESAWQLDDAEQLVEEPLDGLSDAEVLTVNGRLGRFKDRNWNRRYRAIGGVAGDEGALLAEGSFAANAIAAPMSAAAPPMVVPVLYAKADKVPFLGDLHKSLQAPAPGQAGEPAVQVRSDFRSTVFWQPDVMTGKDGKATIKVTYPDSLTSWKATARAVTTLNQFGIAETNTRTKQPLVVRLEAPRFFVVGDTVTISAVVNNNTDHELSVKPKLELGGVFSDVHVEPDAVLKVPGNGEARADWIVKVSTPGEAKLKVIATGDKFADAMEKEFTIYEHGIEKFISKSGKVNADAVTVKLDLPKERKDGSTTMTVQITPSMAVTMLDALPYLIDYPYGCTEQTMSRFLPAVITAKTLKDLGLKPEDIMCRVFGGIEATSAAATHSHGKHDLDELDKITKQSLERLYDFQHSDGGWGWWKEGDSDHFMSAYVVWGLSLARDAGVKIKEDVLRRGAKYLDARFVDEKENPDTQAWMLHAYSVYIIPHKNNLGLLGEFAANAETNLWNRRDQLNAYSRALFALAEHNLDNHTRAKTLIENLENGVKIDSTPDQSVLIGGNQQPSTAISTAHWGNDGIYWHWSDGGVEATAFALRALLAIEPTNHLVEPVSNWLIKNRRGAQWNNTRDTAITVLAMNDYLRVSGELTTDLEYVLHVNGHGIVTNKIASKDVFNAPSRFVVDGSLIRDGMNDISIERSSGHGSIYFSADAKFFSLEEPITPVGNEIFVKRQYYKLESRPTLLKGYVQDRVPLNDGESVKSGDRVETVVTIDAKNNYEYLLFEDLKPAGFETVQVRSGESLNAYELKSGAVERKFGSNDTNKVTDSTQPKANEKTRTTKNRRRVPKGLIIPPPVTDEDHTGRSRWVYEELRDRKVALFIDHLPQGIWEMKYEFRAETPGEFHALPVLGQAMYVPEIRCNSAEVRVNVVGSDK